MPPTHFLCLPLITPNSRPQLERSLAHLRNITKEGHCKIPESAYRPLGVLHLTLGVMSLTPARLHEALEMLQDTDLEALLTWAENRPKTPAPKVTATAAPETQGAERSSTILRTLQRPVSPPTLLSAQVAPLTISLRGLSAFPDTGKATVLHAKPHDLSDRLYYFSLALRQNFIDAGFIAPEERPMVLHATLVNTFYAESSRERKREHGRGIGKVTMDARALVRALNGRDAEEDQRVKREAEEAFVWAEGVEIDRVRVCKMGAKKVDAEVLGFEYEVVGEKMMFSS